MEIDRTIRKVEEGTAAFDRMFDKLKEADGQMAKAKLEDDLKKEIKKLQRYRCVGPTAPPCPPPRRGSARPDRPGAARPTPHAVRATSARPHRRLPVCACQHTLRPPALRSGPSAR